MTHLFETKTADSAHKAILSSDTRPFSAFLTHGSGYEASVEGTSMPTTLGQ